MMGLVMSITLLVAMIGCLTGILSLGIEFMSYLANKPHFKIDTYNELCNVACINNDVIKCYLHIRIINTGNKPLILQDIYMRRAEATRNILNNLVHYNKALSSVPWTLCNGKPVKKQSQFCTFAYEYTSRGYIRINFVVYRYP